MELTIRIDAKGELHEVACFGEVPIVKED